MPLETADEPTQPAVADPDLSVVAPTPVPVPAVSDDPTSEGEKPTTLIGLGLAGAAIGAPLVAAGVKRVRPRAKDDDMDTVDMGE